MSLPEPQPDVVIVGGGPVGLYLAGLMGSMNFHVIVLEKRLEIDRHSKSLGIHPVSMELFEEAGVQTPFLTSGIAIRKGVAHTDQEKIGEVDFGLCPAPYAFILALPQYRTEQILETWIDDMDTVDLIRGAEFRGIKQNERQVTLTYSLGGEFHELQCSYVVGCDGKNSVVRRQAGLEFTGKTYPDTYVMGDFSDNTDFGPDAAVYLHREGLVESFPLPGNMRRWVVKTDSYIRSPDRAMIETEVMKRVGLNLEHQTNSMLSGFGVQHFLADKLHAGKVALAGDSAHVVSPIGGQGMNLGWLNARNLAQTLKTCLNHPEESRSALKAYSKTARDRAKTVAKRAELNMWLGRKRRFPLIRNLLAQMIVNTPLQKKMARIFTMREL
ncbi:MAG: FAD-dependent monooxygenase [Bacteroidetes bacterium]|jgi:2-polyprenyl-6-methoxyphenol hydroxylase-like FAD-dependent oxidoreductase|nr:FAD-dependent monooxygenase [Bacteroidota bacterium]